MTYQQALILTIFAFPLTALTAVFTLSTYPMLGWFIYGFMFIGIISVCALVAYLKLNTLMVNTMSIPRTKNEKMTRVGKYVLDLLIGVYLLASKNIIAALIFIGILLLYALFTTRDPLGPVPFKEGNQPKQKRKNPDVIDIDENGNIND